MIKKAELAFMYCSVEADKKEYRKHLCQNEGKTLESNVTMLPVWKFKVIEKASVIMNLHEIIQKMIY